MNKNIISLENIAVSFDGEKILNDINLDIKDKEFVTFLGPSGCGKTTTLRIIGGFLKPDSGIVRFDGKEINNIPPYKRNVNTVFQRYALFPHLNVYDNITFPLELDGTQIDKDFIQELLETLNISDKQEMLPAMLSGGEQQRVAIIRALATKPAIILADEPTGNLDSQNSSEVIALLKETSKKYEQTIIMITHNRSIAQTADRVLQVSDGTLTDFGRCRE